MVQASNGWIIATIIISAVILLGAVYILQPAPVEPTDLTGLGNIIASQILAGIVIPEIDTTTQDRICELTDGCEYWTGSTNWLNELDVEDAEEDFLEALSDLADIDEDYLEYEYSYRDSQVRTYSDADRDDNNWEIKVFVKINYFDTDDVDEDERVYLLITSTLDEGDYDSLTIEEVSRDFEF